MGIADSSFPRKREARPELEGKGTTLHEYRGYVFKLSYMPDGYFTVDFMDFDSIITGGDRLEKAFHNACEALDLYLETLEELERPTEKPGWRLVEEAIQIQGINHEH